MNDPPDDCIASILTPLGRGAVATVTVVGLAAGDHVARLFRPASGRPLIEIPPGRIVFGFWRAAKGRGEEVVVCRRTASEVEIHCHGGRIAARVIMDSLVSGGCREIPWTAVANLQVGDRIAREARTALTAARTDRTAAILLDQLRGALRSSLGEVAERLAAGDAVGAADRLRVLERRAVVGLHLTNPWRIVLTGQPNVGKSSLINAILGYERSIVYEQPGTTRDVVTAHTAVSGWPVDLADTAGLREGGDAVEAAGVELAHKQLAAADLVVPVFDASRAWTEQDQSLVGRWPEAVLVHNKCDLTSDPLSDRPAGVRTSAVSGMGVARLTQRMAQRLVPDPPPPDSGVPFTERQLGGIREARRNLEAGDRQRAREVLDELLQ